MLRIKFFFVAGSSLSGKRNDVVPSFQPMGNLFEQCLLITFDMIVMTLVDETPDLSFEKCQRDIETWNKEVY